MNGRRGRRPYDGNVVRMYAALFLLMALGITQAWAVSAGKSAGAILKVGMGARSAALGEAYSALGDDVYASYYNPAGAGRMTQAEVGVQHLVWLQSMAAEYAGVAYPLPGGRHTVGGSVLLFRSGDLDRAVGDVSGDYDPALSVGTFVTSNLVASAVYAYTLGTRDQSPIHLGVSLKLVRDVVDDKAVQTVGADVGAQAHLGRDIRIGLALANLGGNLGADSLTGALRAGAVYEGIKKLKIPVEITLPFDKSRLKVGGGVEFWALDWLAVRGGVHTGEPLVPSGGLGLVWRGASLDYAFASFSSALGAAHRISLTYRFGSVTDTSSPRRKP